MRAVNGQKVTQSHLLLAAIVDRLSILAWQNTEDGHNGRNQPKSIVEMMTEDKRRAKYKTFSSGSEFEQAWAQLTKGT